MSQLNEPIAIVGMDCLFPRSGGLASYWTTVREGHDAITPVPESHWRVGDYFDADPASPDHTYGRAGGFISPIEFRPLDFGMAPNALEATDTSQLLSLVVARRALADAGCDSLQFDRERTSVILGVTGALELVIPLGARLGHPLWRRAMAEAGIDDELAIDAVNRISEGYVEWQEASFPGLLGNVVAGRIANRLDLGGTNCVVDAACASSLSAIHLAMLELWSGQRDLVVTGGVDTFNDIFMYMCFSKTPALSPTGHARPFANDADGTVLGEGVGILVLKRLADARRDGSRIYAVIRGMGAASDGKGQAVYAPAADGQARALRECYRQAGVSPASITLVEAHGTGTKVGDATELRSLTEVFADGNSEQRPWCALGSVKSQIGHTKAAAGVAGLMKAALALHHKVLPPSIKVDTPLPGLGRSESPFYLNNVKRPWLPRPNTPRRAAVSAFGFGGSNFHCLLEEAQAGKAAADYTGDVQIWPLSGEQVDALEAELTRIERIANDPLGSRRAAAIARAAFRPTATHRLLLVWDGGAEPTKLVTLARRALREHTAEGLWVAPDHRVIYGRGRSDSEKLAILFPGQGAQYPFMLRDLCCQFPEALQTLCAADAAMGGGLADHIYPIPSFDAAAEQKQRQELTRTSRAQPAIGAVSLGAYRVLQSFGVAADAFAGHSYGELSALCAAGRLAESDFHSLSRLRGELMEAGDGDRGTMIAVRAAQSYCAAFLERTGLDLVVANLNGPTQCVLAGATTSVHDAAQRLAREGVQASVLDVAAAFHSEYVAAAAAPFAEKLSTVTFAAGTAPVYANSTGQRYPVESAEARATLAEQLTVPVKFHQQIEALYAAGNRSFLEVGPSARLTGLVDQILAERPHHAVALDRTSGKQSGEFELARVLAWLAGLGRRVDLTRWDSAAAELPDTAAQDRFSIKICGANYVSAKQQRPPVPPRQPAAAAPSPTTTPAIDDVRSHVQEDLARPIATSAQSRLQQAIEISEEHLRTLQRFQEQTAELHRQFLGSQERAFENMRALFEQHSRLIDSALGVPAQGAPPPAPLPSAEPGLPLDRHRLAVPAHPSESFAGDRHNRAASAEVAPDAVVAGGVEAVASLDIVATVLLEVIAEKTGYPTDLLELSMSLDADLGIDSIKRVEIMSAVSQRMPQIPPVTSEDMTRIQTLNDAVALLAGAPSAAQTAPAFGAPAGGSHASLDTVATVLLEVIAEKTGYPTDLLELSMSLDADLGIDSIKRVEIMSAVSQRMPQIPPVTSEDMTRIQTLNDAVALLAGAPSAEQTAPEPVIPGPPTNPSHATKLKAARVVPEPWLPSSGDHRRGGRVDVVGQEGPWLHALVAALRDSGFDAVARSYAEGSDGVDGLVLVGSLRPSVGEVHEWFTEVRSAAAGLRARGGFLWTVARLDGRFGWDGLPAGLEPLSGALAGLAKTAASEWPEVSVVALDLAADAKLEDAGNFVAGALAKGPIERGFGAGGQWSTARLSPVEIEAMGSISTDQLAGDDVIVVSGGARGITAAATAALSRASAHRPRFVLLGRSELADTDPSWAQSEFDPDKLRAAAIATRRWHSPAAIEQQVRTVLAQREVRATLRQLRDVGAQVTYRSVDVRDAAAVGELLESVHRDIGPVTGIIHGAGVLADRLIEDKSDAQFAEVFDTKVVGLLNLLEGVDRRTDSLRLLALFSSSTARFGRRGQVDYAMANEVLNKIAGHAGVAKPGCRAFAVDWGPWRGGMVTNGLVGIFEAEGVGLIDVEAGADWFAGAVGSTVGPEVVVLAERDSPTAHAESNAAVQVLELSVDAESHPFLTSHVFDGRAVLPAAIILEWLADGAARYQPGLAPIGVDGLRIFKRLAFHEGEARRVQVWTGPTRMVDDVLQVTAELRSEEENSTVVHAIATVLLGREYSAVDREAAPAAPNGVVLRRSEIYPQLLFHGTHMRSIAEVTRRTGEGISATLSDHAPSPADWIREPLRGRWLTDPLAVDTAFQLMILWSLDQHGHPSLPTFVGRYRQFVARPAGRATAVHVRVVASGPHHARADIDIVDASGQLLAAIDGYECVIDASLRRAFEHRDIVSTH
jgi:acyl transferase domain-containing protein